MDYVKQGYCLMTPDGVPVRYRQEANAPDPDTGCIEGNSISTYLTLDEGEPIWVCDSAEQAEWVKHNDTPWYNADMETPGHSALWRDAESLVVCQYHERVQVTPLQEQPSIPTVEEIMRRRGTPEEKIPDLCRYARNDYDYDLYTLEKIVRGE